MDGEEKGWEKDQGEDSHDKGGDHGNPVVPSSEKGKGQKIEEDPGKETRYRKEDEFQEMKVYQEFQGPPAVIRPEVKAIDDQKEKEEEDPGPREKDGLKEAP